MESNSWNLSLPFQWMPFRQPGSMGMILPPESCFFFLEELDLSYCNLGNESFPVDIGCLSSLERLDLSGNNFTNIPASCIANLSKLYYLKLDCCPRLELIPVLPPHVERLYGRNCSLWKPLSDPQDLCDFFASHQQMRRWYKSFFIIPGTEIPPWFNNQNYFHMEICSPFHWETINTRGSVDTRRRILPSACDSLVSIIVDIPHYCLSSEWWGIAVCLVLENQFSCRWDFAPLYWICKTPGAELPVPSGTTHLSWIEEFSDPHLCILLLSGDERNIQRHLGSDSNQLQLLFFAEATPHEVDEIDDPGMLNISKCGYRVLYKEDLDVWGKAMSERKQGNNFEIPSSSLNVSRIREIVGEDSECYDGFEGESANTSNAEAKRRKLG